MQIVVMLKIINKETAETSEVVPDKFYVLGIYSVPVELCEKLSIKLHNY
jgi:hypothetical protein